MSELVKREVPIVGPATCAFCGTHEGPFVDTSVDLLGYGRINICARDDDRGAGCAEQIGLVGENLVRIAALTQEQTERAALSENLALTVAELDAERAISRETIDRLADRLAGPLLEKLNVKPAKPAKP